MSNQITQPPNKNYNFGLDFNYSVWTPGTEISLVNVPWNNDYRDIVRFPNRVALDAYIDERENAGTPIKKLSYVKPNMPVRVNIPINRAIRYNYLRATNPLQPIPGQDIARSYYYFITDVRYLSPNTTELILQLDVWQTFGYDVQFGTCYVERGHIGIANEKNFDSFGRDYLTVPEGLNVGNEYRVITKRTEDVVGTTYDDGEVHIQHNVLVISAVDLEADPGVWHEPNLQTPEPSRISDMVSGAGMYLFRSIEVFQTWMREMSDAPWVTQGILSITIVPPITRYGVGVNFPELALPYKIVDAGPAMITHSMFENWRDSSEILNFIPAKYRHLRKFFTFPYMLIEMTTWAANPILLKPEAWRTSHARVLERVNYLPPNQRVQFIPRAYNSSGQTPDYAYNISEEDMDEWVGGLDPEDAEYIKTFFRNRGDDFGDYLDVMTQITNFPTMPIVNDMAVNFLASNQASIGFQKQSAGWTQNKALRSASTGYDQASGAIETSRALNEIAVNADILQTGNINRTQVAQTVVSGVADIVGGAGKGMAGGAIGGGRGMAAGAAIGAGSAALGAAANLINAGIQTAANDEALSIRNAAAAGNIAATASQGEYVRDTNKSLADWAARGDYANEIAGINARVEDAEMIQPSMSGQFGGDPLNYSNGTMELSVRWKLIDDASIRRIGDFWLRYGYAINTSMSGLPADMMVMSKFTYWKLTESYLISGPMPENIKQSIRGIFEKGVTVWRDPDYIGTTDLGDNVPLEGISY